LLRERYTDVTILLQKAGKPRLATEVQQTVLLLFP